MVELVVALALFASCKSEEPASIAVTGISLDKPSLELTEGETASLKATVTPDNATDKTVYWSSSDDAVATVNGGTVTAVKPGSATVTVTAKDGGKTAKCSVTVKAKAVSVTGISLDKTSLELTEGDSETLTATVAPDNASNKKVKWSSADEKVATVDSYGKVTAVAAGETTVTATTEDDGKKAECNVKVNAKAVFVTSIAFEQENVTITDGKTTTNKVIYTPDDAGDKGVSYEYSVSGIAEISDEGVITALKPGKTRITAILKSNSSIKAYCYVNVEKDATLKNISFEYSELTLKLGRSKTLTVVYTPEYAADKTVTWSSSETSVATVVDGVVTGVGPGNATITATSQEGGFKATCEVTVEETGTPDVYYISRASDN